MSKVNDGGPAFPNEESAMNKSTDDRRGMTLRDYFAAHAEPLERICSTELLVAITGRERPHNEVFTRWGNGDPSAKPTRQQWIDYQRWWREADAINRYIQADAMLAARAEGGAS